MEPLRIHWEIKTSRRNRDNLCEGRFVSVTEGGAFWKSEDPEKNPQDQRLEELPAQRKMIVNFLLHAVMRRDLYIYGRE